MNIAALLLLWYNAGAQWYGTTFNIVNYGVTDYNSHNQNWDIVQDDRGILYFANGDGVMQYDGVQWSKILTSRATTVLSLAINQQQEIYVGGINEIGYLAIDSTGYEYHVSLSESLPEEQQNFTNVWETHVDGNRTLFRTLTRLFVCSNKQITTMEPQEEFIGFFKVGDRFMVRDGQDRFAWIEGEALVPLPNTDFFVDKSIIDIVPGPGDTLLFFTQTHGAYKYMAGDTVRAFGEIDWAGTVMRAQCATKLRNGNIAVGSAGGVFILSPEGKLRAAIGQKEGLKHGRIADLFEDREGNLWCAHGKGIAKIILHEPLTIMPEGKAYTGIINSMCLFEDQLYLGTSDGVFRVNETTQTTTKIEGMGEQIFDLLPLKDGILAGSTDGLYWIQNNAVTLITRNFARAIAPFNNNPNRYLIGGREEAHIIERNGNQWKVIFTISPFPDEVLNIIGEKNATGDQLFWMGLFSNGVAKLTFVDTLTNYTVDVYGKEQGIKDGYLIPYATNFGTRFCSKFDEVFYYDPNENAMKIDQSISQFITEEASSYLLAQGKGGEMYLEVSGPIYLLQQSEGGFIANKAPFSRLDIGYVNDIVFDRNNICLLGAEAGLARFDPYVEKNYQLPFSATIRKVISGQDSLVFSGTYHNEGQKSTTQPAAFVPTFRYKNNELVFHYAAPFYGADKVRYSYLLEGYSEDWSNWSLEPKAVFTNLDEGTYTFNVKARNLYGVESTEAAYSFVILSPWYRTFWAYILYVVIGMLLLYGIISMYVKRLKQANLRLENIIRDRTAEIREQKEQIEEKSNEILDSIQYAKRLQKAMFPAVRLVKQLLPDSFVFFKPKDIVSGDFYWLEQKGNKVYFAAVDCTGHGVPGAMVSIIGHNGLTRCINEFDIDQPAAILDQLDTLVIEKFSSNESQVNDGMDIALCSFDTQTLELQYAGAHNALYYIQNNELKVIKADRQPIGGRIKKSKFTNHTVQLQPSDLVYIFSDGFADQFGGPKGKKFMYGQFKKLLLSIHQQPMEEQQIILRDTFENWRGSLEQVDDVCVFGVRVRT